jgi:hypothetical protein
MELKRHAVTQKLTDGPKDPLAMKIQQFPDVVAWLLVTNAVFTLGEYFITHGGSLASIRAVHPGA